MNKIIHGYVISMILTKFRINANLALAKFLHFEYWFWKSFCFFPIYKSLSLGAPVPPAALYIFQLSTSIDGKPLPDPKRTYASACILMEALTMEGLQIDEVNVTKTFFCL